MKKWTDIIEKLTMLTQLSLSLVTPLLLCLGLCWWSSNRWSLGGWIYMIGFFFGLGGSAMTAWKFYRSVVMRQERTEKEKKNQKYLSTDIFRKGNRTIWTIEKKEFSLP